MAAALNPEAIHSDLNETVTLQLQAGQELQTGRGKSLQSSWQTIVPDIDDAPAIAVLPEVEKYRPKGLPSTNPELEDDDEKWGLVPYFGILLVFFSWIVQSGLGAIKRKAAWLKLEPNALRSTGSVNGPRRPTIEDQFKPSGTRPPALDKLAAAFSTAGERQQKAPDEKTWASLEHCSDDPDVERTRAKFEHTQEIEETFHKDFDGIGLGEKSYEFGAIARWELGLLLSLYESQIRSGSQERDTDMLTSAQQTPFFRPHFRGLSHRQSNREASVDEDVATAHFLSGESAWRIGRGT